MKCLCFRVMYTQSMNRHYSSMVSLMMALDRMHSSGSEKHLDPAPKDTLFHIPRNTLAGNFPRFNFVVSFFSFDCMMILIVQFRDSLSSIQSLCSKLSFLISHSIATCNCSIFDAYTNIAKVMTVEWK